MSPARPHWLLECSACATTAEPAGLPTICVACGQPWLVRYPVRSLGIAHRAQLSRERGLRRFRRFLPLLEAEDPVSLGEGDTPLLSLVRTAARLGLEQLWLKDESTNPTGSFKARGLAMAVTRAAQAGVSEFVIPTAGNAGVALAAYAARAGCRAKVFAPAGTPPTILAQIRWFGGDLELVPGHIGDCGRESQSYAARTGAFPMATLREPYRVEGKKTLGLEIALQLDWTLPDVIIYPAGGGTGLIGMWLAFRELLAAGWVEGQLPRLYAVQSSGCAPLVRAVETGADRCEPWPEPQTVASGLRVPAPLGGALMLRAIRDSGGSAIAVADDDLTSQARETSRAEGLDLSPEGGATLSGLAALLARGDVQPEERIVVFNTGGGWLYRG